MQLTMEPVDEMLAERALPELRALSVPLTIERIVEATAAAFGTPARLLRGRSRRPDLVRPRQVAMYLTRRLLRRPFVELGRWFARDHTTVVHAAQVITARLGVDRALAAMVGELERRLRHDVG